MPAIESQKLRAQVGPIHRVKYYEIKPIFSTSSNLRKRKWQKSSMKGCYEWPEMHQKYKDTREVPKYKKDRSISALLYEHKSKVEEYNREVLYSIDLSGPPSMLKGKNLYSSQLSIWEIYKSQLLPKLGRLKL